MVTDEVAEIDPDEGTRIQSAVGQLRQLLVPGERIEAWAVERRLFALTHRRALVAATSGRLILIQRGLLAGFRLQDVRWQDLKDVRLHVGVFGADLVVSALSSSDLAVAGQAGQSLVLAGLRKDQAPAVYRVCQTHEQAWREKRRIRELEELRAKSGGIVLGPGPGLAAPPAGTTEGEDAVARLERAKEMLSRGLISDAEYESIKARVVSGL